MQDSKKIQDDYPTHGSEVQNTVERAKNAQLSSTAALPQFTSPEMHLPQFTLPEMRLPQIRPPVMRPPQVRPLVMRPYQVRPLVIPVRPPVMRPLQFPWPEMRRPQFPWPEIRPPQFTSPTMSLPRFTSPWMFPCQFRSPTWQPVSRRIQIQLIASKGQVVSLVINLDDTVGRLKQYIKQRKGWNVPINRLVLIQNNIEMQDSKKLREYNLTNGSNVVVFVKPAAATLRRIQIQLNIPPIGKMSDMEIDVEDTVERLKHQIKEREGISIPINRIVLCEPLGLIEMQDKVQIRDYHLTDGGEVHIFIKPEVCIPDQAKLPTATMASSSASSSHGRVRVYVQIHNGDKMVMEFNAEDKIEVIRRDLERLKKSMKFDLPGRYFFIHDENQMEEDKSFVWHKVRQGAIILVFPEKLTQP